QVVPFSSSV
nr:Chain B, cypin peptide [synthetic construct]2KA9_C Chain C, cypin peptide [synthetic construct]